MVIVVSDEKELRSFGCLVAKRLSFSLSNELYIELPPLTQEWVDIPVLPCDALPLDEAEVPSYPSCFVRGHVLAAHDK